MQLSLQQKHLNWAFLQVIINFPDPSHKSDIVQFRGPKNEVEKCTKYMQKMVADLVGDIYIFPLCNCVRIVANLKKSIFIK